MTYLSWVVPLTRPMAATCSPWQGLTNNRDSKRQYFGLALDAQPEILIPALVPGDRLASGTSGRILYSAGTLAVAGETEQQGESK